MQQRMPEVRGERLHYLDQLRAFLMFLGIPYHTALAFSVHQPWIVDAAADSPLLSWLAQLSHTFRMPVFFVIAGYFAVMMLRRRGPLPWWRDRLWRLGLPLLTVGLLLNPLQMLAGSMTDPADTMTEWRARLAMPGEHWVAHLWFLIDLLAYCSLLAGLAWIGRRRPGLRAATARAAGWLERHRMLRHALLPLTGAFVVAAVIALHLIGVNNLLNNALVVARTVTHLPVFLLGAALAWRPDWLARFLRADARAWLLALALVPVLAAIQWREPLSMRAATYFLSPIVGILMAHVLMSAARRWFNQASPLTRHLVDSSLTVYLFHQVFIVFGVVLLMESGLPPLAQFLLIVAATVPLCLLVHAAIRRSGTLSLLFNGARPRARIAVPAPVSPPLAPG